MGTAVPPSVRERIAAFDALAAEASAAGEAEALAAFAARPEVARLLDRFVPAPAAAAATRASPPRSTGRPAGPISGGRGRGAGSISS
jgi:hypothetical protein